MNSEYKEWVEELERRRRVLEFRDRELEDAKIAYNKARMRVSQLEYHVFTLALQSKYQEAGKPECQTPPHELASASTDR